MAEEQFKAGIIGLGFVGAGDQVSGEAIGQKVADLDGTHAQALSRHPQIRLVTGSSRDEGRRRRFEERYQIRKSYVDWREMLATEKLDLVSVATNSPSHAEITTACAIAGVRAILCEKPIATRLSDADSAVRVCRERGTILAINHCRRWHPLWRDVRGEILNGIIGDVYHTVVHWSSGRLGNVGSHMFDALRMLLGQEARSVSGELDPVLNADCRGPEYQDPSGWGVVNFSAGIKAFIDAPQAAKFPMAVRIVGSSGQMSLCDNNARLELWNGRTQKLTTATEGSSSMDKEVEDVVQCLIAGGRPFCTGEDGLAALEIVIAFHISHRLRGQRVPLPLTGANRDLEVRIG